MPQKAKPRVGKPKRRVKVPKKKVENTPATGGDAAAEAEELPAWGQGRYSEERMNFFAHLAWAPTYKPILEMEAEINGAVQEVDEHASGYRKAMMRRAGGDDARWESIRRISHDKERLLREKSKHYVPFSQAVLAITYLAEQVKKKVWRREVKVRRVVDREYATKMLWMMHACRPPPEEPANIDLDLFVFDQTYAVEGGGHGAGSTLRGARGIGKIDANGNRIKVKRETYINSFEVHVSQRELQLSDAARDVIGRRGPYTQDFARIKPILVPARSDTFLNKLLIDACEAKGQRAALGVSTAMLALLGRKAIDVGGPTRLDDLPPLMHCDTAELKDGIRIVGHFASYKGSVKRIRAVLGDGQSCLTMSYLKRHWPEMYKYLLIMNGHWHSSGHFQIAGITIFAWKAFYATLAALLQRTPTQERKGTLWYGMKNLDKNAHWHTQQFAYATVVATVVYIVNHVKSPPPELFVQNPMLYCSMVQNASGIVMIEALRNIGLPTVAWHQAAREVDGKKVDKLHAHAYHVFRCTHKTKSQYISIIHLLTMYATHPELREWLWASQSAVLIQFAQYYDRIMEGRNDMQKSRNVGHSMMNALHFTPVQTALRHVKQTWRATELGGKEGEDDGVRHTMPNEVKLIVDYFVQTIGTDLASYTENNLFWHTGLGRNLRNDTNIKEHRFWEYMERVAEGTSVPDGTARARPWDDEVEDVIRNHMFYKRDGVRHRR